jgi:hypothetical protein
MLMAENFCDIRLVKLDAWARSGRIRYPDRFEKTHTCAEAGRLQDGTADVLCAGRLIAIQKIGCAVSLHKQFELNKFEVLRSTAFVPWALNSQLADYATNLSCAV